MKKLIYIFLLCLIGCGSSTVTVTYHTVSLEQIQAKGTGHNTGFAEWDFNTATCDIYMIPMEEYFSEEEYHRVLGHEMRHCLEGEFH